MKLKQILCPMMATMMLLSCTAAASASSADDLAAPDYEAADIIRESLGGIEDQDGYLVDDMQSRAAGLPFKTKAFLLKVHLQTLLAIILRLACASTMITMLSL